MIRSTDERPAGVALPANHAAVFSCGAAGASVIVIPPEKDQPAVIVTPDIVYSLLCYIYYCIPPAAAKYRLAKLSGPRTLAVAVSVAYVIRSTVDRLPPGK